MQCLECWYLGDPIAIAEAGLIKPAKAAQLSRSAKLRNPDRLTYAKTEFLKLHDETGQMRLARMIAPHLDPERNRSHSFRLVAATLKSFA